MTDLQLMQQALEALELLAWYENPATKVQVRKPRGGGPIVTMYPHKVATEAAAPLRERLAQPEQETVMAEYKFQTYAAYKTPDGEMKIGVVPEQEPVAWVTGWHDGHCVIRATNPSAILPIGIALYTTPPRREWVGLTDDEIAVICGECAASAHRTDDISYARAIEAKLKEKNNG